MATRAAHRARRTPTSLPASSEAPIAIKPEGTREDRGQPVDRERARDRGERQGDPNATRLIVYVGEVLDDEDNTGVGTGVGFGVGSSVEVLAPFNPYWPLLNF